MPDNPAAGSRHSFSKPLYIRRGWVKGGRHSSQGVLSFCDGSASTANSKKLQEHMLTMFDRYLTDPSDTLRFMLPQYAAVPY